MKSSFGDENIHRLAILSFSAALVIFRLNGFTLARHFNTQRLVEKMQVVSNLLVSIIDSFLFLVEAFS